MTTKYPDLRRDRAGGGGIQDRELYRRVRRAEGLMINPPRSRHPRHQDAAHGRHGDSCNVCARSAFPVIFLTSKDDEVDEVLGLPMGADDYIKKPFSQRC